MCRPVKFVTVGDPTGIQVGAYGLVSSVQEQDVSGYLTYDQACASVALATLGALLVWLDTGNPSMIVIPIFLLWILREKTD